MILSCYVSSLRPSRLCGFIELHFRLKGLVAPIRMFHYSLLLRQFGNVARRSHAQVLGCGVGFTAHA
jgi:hypothetical protein